MSAFLWGGKDAYTAVYEYFDWAQRRRIRRTGDRSEMLGHKGGIDGGAWDLESFCWTVRELY